MIKVGGSEFFRIIIGVNKCQRQENHTPPKTNMEPENGPLEKEIPIGNHHFQVPAVNFWGCMSIFFLGEGKETCQLG